MIKKFGLPPVYLKYISDTQYYKCLCLHVCLSFNLEKKKIEQFYEVEITSWKQCIYSVCNEFFFNWKYLKDN